LFCERVKSHGAVLPPDQQKGRFGMLCGTFWRMITEDSRSMLRGTGKWTTDRRGRTFALAEMGAAVLRPYLPGLDGTGVPCPYWGRTALVFAGEKR